MGIAWHGLHRTKGAIAPPISWDQSRSRVFATPYRGGKFRLSDKNLRLGHEAQPSRRLGSWANKAERMGIEPRLLEVDAIFRERVGRDEPRRVAPSQLRAERGNRKFTGACCEDLAKLAEFSLILCGNFREATMRIKTERSTTVAYRENTSILTTGEAHINFSFEEKCLR